MWRRRDSKFGNIPQQCGEGITHQSKAEARRCTELHTLQAGGLISDLQAHPQPRRRLVVNGVKIADYMPDFEYLEEGTQIIEDVKGVSTGVYKLKRRLVEALWPECEFRETKAYGRRR